MRRSWWIGATLALLAIGVVACARTSGTSSTVERSVATTCPSHAPGDPVVRGSLEQIDITSARPRATVRVSGPAHFTASARTDARGGLLFRDVPAGGPYDVTIEGDATSPHSVRVASLHEPPDQSFYTSQTLTFDRTGVDQTDGYITTRDCTELSYRVQLPKGPEPEHGYDTIITYSGYAPGLRPGYPWDQAAFDAFTAQGYAVVGVNMRGTGCSGGAFDLMEPIVAQDGYDVVETVAAQHWVHRVAMAGKSWPGLSQLFVAATRPPHLTAIVPGAPVADLYRDVVAPGGIPNDGFAQYWAKSRDDDNAFPSMNPSVRDITDDTDVVHGTPDDASCIAHQTLRGQNQSTVRAWSEHPSYERVPPTGAESRADAEYNAYWRARTAPVNEIRVPTLMTIAWQDEQVGSRAAEVLRSFDPSTHVRLVGTNGDHDAYYTGRTWHYVTEFLCVYLRDHCSKSVARYEAENPVRILLESNPSGVPRSELTLPRLATGAEGKDWRIGRDLHADPGDGGSSTASRFTYAPRTSSWYQARQDRVKFTSSALPSDVVMAGSGAADLWVAANRPDVDLQVIVSEVRPDGNEQVVQVGWLRASDRAEPRHSSESTPLRPFHAHDALTRMPLTPGTPAKVRVEIPPFAHAFRAGSKVRVTVSGPGGWTDDASWHFAALPGPFPVTVEHDAAHVSSVDLPVVSSASVHLAPGVPPCDQTWSQPCRQIITVNTTRDGADARPGDGACEMDASKGDCSLRAAVQEANALVGGATIQLHRETYTLTGTAGEDAGATGDLDLTDETVIEGEGATIDGGHVDRVFDVRSGARVLLENVVVTGGSAGGEDGGAARVGGCLGSGPAQVCSRLDLLHSTLSGNTALRGGAVAASGPLSVIDSTIASNAAERAGGGIFTNSWFEVIDSSLLDNIVRAAGSLGGGVAFGATPAGPVLPPRILGSLILRNAAGRGGGIASQNTAPIRLQWSTVAQNRGGTGAELLASIGASFSTRASIVSAGEGGGTSCSGTVTSSGRNISDDASCGLDAARGDRPGIDPGVLASGDLTPSSPARLAAGSGCPSPDVRGHVLVPGAACALGAVQDTGP